MISKVGITAFVHGHQEYVDVASENRCSDKELTASATTLA